MITETQHYYCHYYISAAVPNNLETLRRPQCIQACDISNRLTVSHVNTAWKLDADIHQQNERQYA